MKNKILEIVKEIDFANRYILLCNRFLDFDNGKNFTKQEVLDLLIDIGIEMKFISKEKVFLKDFFINDFTVRLLFSYKHGYIDFRYWIFNDTETILNDSFRGVALLQDIKFNEKVSYRFPIATSISDLHKILSKLIKLNNDFIDEINAL